MSGRPGLVWGGRTPDQLRTQVSAFRQDLTGDEMTDLIDDIESDAAQDMREKIEQQDRILSRQMIESVDFESSRISNNRIRGRFGYLDNPPKWTLWQEYGTQGGQGNGSGIVELLALSDAYERARVRLEDEVPGRIVQLAEGAFS